MKYAIASALLVAAASAETIQVKAGWVDGQIGLKYVPEEIRAAEGDVVEFEFWPQHDVIAGPFDQPCVNTQGGIYSGRLNFQQPIDPNVASTEKFAITITNASQPLWMYCTTARHCVQGMVAVINPPNPSTGRTLEAYRTAAAQFVGLNGGNGTRPNPPTRSGGELVTGEDSGTPTHSNPPATPTPTGAAGRLEISGALAMIAGVAAWFL